MKNEEAGYRLKLAEGYLEEARQDVSTRRWRSCAANSQLATENAAKAILALIGPVSRTHDPGRLLMEALERREFPDPVEPQLRRVAECAAGLGSEVHLESSYGDEATRRTPWEIFSEKKARDALRLAEEAVGLTAPLVQGGLR